MEKENINDINTEFIEPKENKDFISNKGNRINQKLSKYVSLIGSLNNITNLFMYEKEKIINEGKNTDMKKIIIQLIQL